MGKKVYFAFHYQDVIDQRADVVRNHWLAKADRLDAGFWDSATWGDSSLAGHTSIKRLLVSGLDDTSVTCVLIGSQTSARRWVRYEIIESIQRGNLLIGVHINGIPDKSQQTKPPGPNPFEQLTLAIAADGASIKVLQYTNGSWLPYQDNPGWPLSKPAAPERRGKRIQLSSRYRVYDWVTDNGPENLEKWVGA
jgi:Thoeris protein ThsB, TIR-like domain